MTTFESNSLWDFSLLHYGKLRVAKACLQLQDKYGVNINVLLWSLWLETEKMSLTHDRLVAALAAIQPWEINYVQPLRELRRRIKQDFVTDLTQVENLRQYIKRAELEAEYHEQLSLEKLALNWSKDKTYAGKDLSQTNLSFYLHYLILPPDIIAETLIACST